MNARYTVYPAHNDQRSRTEAPVTVFMGQEPLTLKGAHQAALGASTDPTSTSTTTKEAWIRH